MLFGGTCCETDFHDQPKTSDKRGRTQGNGVCRQGNPCVNICHNNIDSVKVEIDLDEGPPPVKIQKHRKREPKAVRVFHGTTSATCNHYERVQYPRQISLFSYTCRLL